MGQLGARRWRGGSPKRSVRFAWDAFGRPWLSDRRETASDTNTAADCLLASVLPTASTPAEAKTKVSAPLVTLRASVAQRYIDISTQFIPRALALRPGPRAHTWSNRSTERPNAGAAHRRAMEPDPTALSAPLNDDTDDDELYERLQRRHVVKEKATYVCLVLFIMLLLAAALPAMLYWLAAYKKATPDKFLLPVSLIFAGISIPISIHGIRQHLTNFWQPVLQVYVVRILWMVPVYAICSLLSLIHI